MYFAAVVDCLNDGVTFVRLIEWPHSAIDDSSSNHTIDQTAATFLHIFFFYLWFGRLWPMRARPSHVSTNSSFASNHSRAKVVFDGFDDSWSWNQNEWCRLQDLFAALFSASLSRFCFWVRMRRIEILPFRNATFSHLFDWIICVFGVRWMKKKKSFSFCFNIINGIPVNFSTAARSVGIHRQPAKGRDGAQPMEKILPRRKFANSFTTSIQLSIDKFILAVGEHSPYAYRTFIPIQTSGVQP